MKRILFVHQTSAIGGGSYCLLNILREIDKSMIEPVVCLASDGPLRKEIESLKISVVFFRKMVDIRKHPIKYPFSLLYFHCTFAFAILHELLTYFHYDTRTI